MEWLTNINSAIDHIEANITEKVDYAKVASIARCSLSRFQNMFLFITDVTPAEYVRRRRMVLAAKELLDSEIKIIDLSHKFGYESPEAFTRSFKAFHGIAPSVVRKFGRYVEYPRISFQIQIQGGHFAMGTSAQFEVYKDILVKMDIIELPTTLKFVGLTGEKYPAFKNIDMYHEKYKALIAHKHDPHIEIGLSSSIDSRAWYIFGCMVDSFDDLHEDLVAVDLGLRKFACLTFRMQPGSTSADLVGGEDGGGPGMNIANEYLEEVWIPKNTDKLLGYYASERGYGFNISKTNANYSVANIPPDGLDKEYTIFGTIEVYKTDIETEPEMCYYIPVK